MSDGCMPPTSFYEEMAKHCRCCPGCGHPPCDTACAGGVCLGDCDCAENEDRQREEDEIDYQEDDAR